MIPVLAVLIGWLDAQFGDHLIIGSPALGHYERCGIFPKREVSPSEKSDIFKGAQANK